MTTLIRLTYAVRQGHITEQERKLYTVWLLDLYGYNSFRERRFIAENECYFGKPDGEA